MKLKDKTNLEYNLEPAMLWQVQDTYECHDDEFNNL